MSNSIDFYKGIFLHVISVRVIVPWSDREMLVNNCWSHMREDCGRLPFLFSKIVQPVLKLSIIWALIFVGNENNGPYDVLLQTVTKPYYRHHKRIFSKSVFDVELSVLKKQLLHLFRFTEIKMDERNIWTYFRFTENTSLYFNFVRSVQHTGITNKRQGPF